MATDDDSHDADLPTGTADVGTPDAGGRAADDDYDLLTYNEVAARLGEVLAEERAALGRLCANDPADPTAVAALQRRIELLVQSRDRYEQQAATAEAFLRRFGLAPRPRR